MKPLIPYLRQSRRKERTISIEEQRRVIHAWAAANDVPLGREVVEQGVSGSKSWRERALGSVVDACARGEASGVIVAWQDRLSRENGLATAEVWEALDRAGARLVAAAEGLDTAVGDQEMLFTIKAAIAREAWKRYRENFAQARGNAVERGVLPGRAPYGYTAARNQPLKIVPAQAAKVRAAFAARAAGEPVTTIARRLGWSHSSCSQRLACETYLGVVRHGGFVNENAHPPIVDQALFDAVQGAKTTSAPPRGETTRDRLLVGLVRCSGCGRSMRMVRRKRKTDYIASYYCKDSATAACASRAFVHSGELDSFVAEWFESALRSVPRMVSVVAAGRALQEAQTVLERMKSDLSAFVEMVIDDPVLFQRGLDVRRKRVSEAEDRVQQLSAHQSRLPVGGQFADLWDGFDALERRSVLTGLLDRVEVDRGASASLAGHVRIYWSDQTLAFPEIAHDEERVRVAAA